jgi:exonuclease SbcC
MRITREDLEKWTGEVPPVNLEDHAITVLENLAEKYFYDKRTTANAELKDVINQIESLKAQLPDNYKPEEWKDIELYSMHEKVRAAEEHNNKIIDAKLFVEEFDEKQKEVSRKYDLEKNERLDEDKTRLAEIEEEMNILKLEISSIKGKQVEAIGTIEKERKNALDTLDNILEGRKEFLAATKIMPVDELKAEAKKAEEMKGYLNLAENLKKLEKDEIGKEAEAKRLDKVVEILRKKPADLLSKVQMPIKGLGINEDMQVTIDGLPIANLSTSRQITLAIEIARVTSGELKTICIDRFETLDAEHKKIFMDEISKDDFQYFVTEVTDGPLKVTSMKGSQ